MIFTFQDLLCLDTDACFFRRRKRPKRYPPSLVASEADLDRLSMAIPADSKLSHYLNQSLSPG